MNYSGERDHSSDIPIDENIPSNRNENQSTNNNDESSSERILGLDIPAFDVSAEAVYGNNNDIHPEPTGENGEASNSFFGGLEGGLLDAVLGSLDGSSGDERGTASNLVVTVNYIFTDNENGSRTGSLILSIPNISNNHDDATLQELVRIARNIAYSTIYNTTRRNLGTSIEKFNSFHIKTIESLSTPTEVCPVCYEPYVFMSDVKKNKKCKTDHGDDSQSRKRRKTESASPMEISEDSPINIDEENSSNPEPTPNSTTIPNTPPTMLSQLNGSFKHFPTEMPCGHVFGKSCLFEWLKSNATCPLCRFSVAATPPEDTVSPFPFSTTIELPSSDSLTTQNASANQQFVIISNRGNMENINPTNPDTDLSARIMSLLTRHETRMTHTIDNSENGENVVPPIRTLPSDIQVSEQINQSPNATSSDNVASRTRNRQNPEHLVGDTNSRDNGNSQRRSQRTRSFFNGLFSNILGNRNRNNSRIVPSIRDSLFSTGVASRRTTTGVETVNLDNHGNDDGIINDLLFDRDWRSRDAQRESSGRNNDNDNEENDGVAEEDIEIL